MAMTSDSLRFSPSLCVTHSCNLDCIYCYQNHSDGCKMSIDTAKKCIDWIFENIPPHMNEVEIDFIGGEPLIEFELIKEVSDYIFSKKIATPYILFASTNGTLLNDDMKAWFTEHKDQFWLGLSLDGKKETHDFNRSNSFDLIEIEYFLKNWPEQGVKMTLSEYSLRHFADNINYIHHLGFKKIGGVNLYEGDFDWDKDDYIRLLIPQFFELIEFYLANKEFSLNQMFDKHIEHCESKNNDPKKWCGIGNGANFFDFDGRMYPCAFVTPMTFSETDIKNMMKIDFIDDKNFLDEYCYKECYIYPICPTCSGANYMVNKNFKERNKSKCRIQKLIALFIAEFQGKRLLKDRTQLDDTTVFYMIEAIKKIRTLYLDEFKKFF